jgi:hypothetical protein
LVTIHGDSFWIKLNSLRQTVCHSYLEAVSSLWKYLCLWMISIKLVYFCTRKLIIKNLIENMLTKVLLQKAPFFPVNIRDVTVREYQRGKYHCTINLLFDWFGISSMTTDNFCFHLQHRLIQTSQTGGQWYNDTSPFSIPCHGTLFQGAR